MKVLKFGGTSVGTVESLRNVKSIVEAEREPVIVVVSALGGLTDQLISTAKGAEKGEDFRAPMQAFRSRHQQIIDEMVPTERQKEISMRVSSLLDELEGLYMGVSLLNELSCRTLDRIVSFGERMSSIIVASMIENCEHKDSLTFMRTERWMGKNIADRELTEKGIQDTFGKKEPKRYVTGGFISCDRESGKITNLGRGGSDYTAALIAAALDAEELQIWTDVDGFMTADPRIVPDAKVMPRMSFVESMELCSYGAKVIYPPTIYPVFHKNIPIKILNTHNPGAKGTLITDNVKDLPKGVRGTSVLRKVVLAKVKGTPKVEMENISSRASNSLSRSGISTLLTIINPEKAEFSVVLPAADAENGLNALSDEFAPELGNGEIAGVTLDDDNAVIAIVGEGIKRDREIGGNLREAFLKEGIEIKGMSDGVSESTIAVVVDDKYALKALKLTHRTTINV